MTKHTAGGEPPLVHAAVQGPQKCTLTRASSSPLPNLRTPSAVGKPSLSSHSSSSVHPSKQSAEQLDWLWVNGSTKQGSEPSTQSVAANSRNDSQSEPGTGASVSTSRFSLASGAYDPQKDAVLRLECITEKETKVTMACMEVAVVLGTALLIVEIALKLRKPDAWHLYSKTIYILNLVFALPCVLALYICSGIFLMRVWSTLRQGKRWSRRRKLNARLAAANVAAQIVNVTFWIASNCYVVGRYCAWFDPFIIISHYIQWICWGTLFALHVIWAHVTNPWKAGSDAHADVILLDTAFWRHQLLPCLLWVAFVGVETGEFVVMLHQAGVIRARLGLTATPPSCYIYPGVCRLGPTVMYMILVLILMWGAFILLWVYYINLSIKRLRKWSYSEIRYGHVVVRNQLRMRLYAGTFFITCIVALMYIHIHSCASYAQAWLGCLPLSVVITALTAITCFKYTPVVPSETLADKRDWLQSFAWTEADKVRLAPERRQALARLAPALQNEPMFCFETALKLFYWSCLCYEYQEAVEPAAVTRFSLDTAMALFNLEKFELLWEKREDTKVLLAWNRDTVIVAFRGTASVVNVLADMQAWLSIHPPPRCVKRGLLNCGTVPRVHCGFLSSWQANGLDAKVVQRVNEVINSADIDKGNVKVFVTGHSLGGALATLAAYDIRRGCAVLDGMDIACYTFGAPRTGNHAFAADYTSAVPDSWALINDQDAVAKNAKFVFLYKRPGQRVLLNSWGDLIVRPTSMEATVQRVPYRDSVRDHLLLSYKRAFIAVCIAQFGCKGFQGGKEGILKLAEALPIAELLGNWGGSIASGDGPEFNLLQHLSKCGTLGGAIGGGALSLYSKVTDQHGQGQAGRKHLVPASNSLDFAVPRLPTPDQTAHTPADATADADTAGGDVELGMQHLQK